MFIKRFTPSRRRGGEFFNHDVMIDHEDLIELQKINRSVINDQQSKLMLTELPRMFWNVAMTGKLHDFGETYPVLKSPSTRVKERLVTEIYLKCKTLSKKIRIYDIDSCVVHPSIPLR